MTLFRPCIDLHKGKVKQIVGGSLTDSGDSLVTNFISEKSAGYYAEMYRRDKLKGGHIIQLGEGNEDAVLEALQAWPQGLQIGGGINEENAEYYLNKGASHVILTSWLFPEGKFSLERLKCLNSRIGKEKIVIDLSCRRKGDEWVVAMNRWQTLTNFVLSRESLSELEPYCDEFLIHAADVEGKCEGIDRELVVALSEWLTLPVTYAGGVKSIDDLKEVDQISSGNVDLTIGSALDIFGGKLVAYDDCLNWNRQHKD